MDDHSPVILGGPENFINAVFKRPHGHLEYRLISVHDGYGYGYRHYRDVKMCVCECQDGVRRFVPWYTLRTMNILSVRVPQWS